MTRAFPPWLRKPLPAGGNAVARLLAETGADTVCRGAHCPNRAECQAAGQAAFLLLGPHCTRNCAFCAMTREKPVPPDPDEPRRVAEAAARMSLKHVVVTSVTRDDLQDGGAAHFADTTRALRERIPGVRVELLVPDFNGDRDAWSAAADIAPEVFNHNLETVPRLYAEVRPGADYARSLDLLAYARRRLGPDSFTKSGLMAGLGESDDEIVETARDLRRAGVDMITVGQYLCPSKAERRPVSRFVTPEAFAELERRLRALGFRSVGCGPWVRSSYGAAEAFADAGK